MQYGTSRSLVLRVPSGQIVPDDPKIIDGYVGELRATGAFPHGPDSGRTGLQSLVDANVAAAIQLNPGLLDADPGGIWNPPYRDQDVAALDLLLAGRRAHGNSDFLSGSALHLEGPASMRNSNTFLTEKALHLIRDIRVFPAHELGAGLNDRHAAPEATIGLRHFEADIAASEHDQM